MNFRDGLKFFQENLRQSNSVGAVWPSSPALSATMAEPIFRDRAGVSESEDKPLRILEVGAGLGPVSELLIPQLRPGDTYDIVELNPTFCEHLRVRFAGTGARIHEMSILDWQEEPYDRVVSGLPLANFPADVVAQIYRTFFRLMKPDAFFVMFEYLVIRQALAVATLGEERKRVRRILDIERALLPLQREQIDIYLNVPPARVRVRGRPEHPDTFRL
jgi:phosphatidylethanolamine/phosphatidyl-N-methylethanolamine N-methyltransferase